MDSAPNHVRARICRRQRAGALSEHPSGVTDAWEPSGVATFNVHASWISDSAVDDDAILKVNRTFRPGDQALCTWVDEAEPRRFLVSFDVESVSYATAARECLTVVAAVPTIDPRLGTLEEVGATDEEGYLVVKADDFEELRHLAD